MSPFYASQLSDIAMGRDMAAFSADFPGTTYGLRIDPASEFARSFLTRTTGDSPVGTTGTDDTFHANMGSQTTENLPFGVIPGRYFDPSFGLDRDLSYGLRPNGTLTNVYQNLSTLSNSTGTTEGTGDNHVLYPSLVLEDDLVRQGFKPGSVDRRQPSFEFNGTTYGNPHGNSYMGTPALGWGDYAPGVIFNILANNISGGYYGYIKGAADLLDDGGSGKSRNEKGRILGGMAVGGATDYYSGADTNVSNSGMDFGGPGVGWNPSMETLLGPNGIAVDPNFVANSGSDFGGPGIGWNFSQPTGVVPGPDSMNPFSGMGDSLVEFLRRGGKLDDWMKNYGIYKGGPLSTLWNLGTGAYGLYQARQMSKQADQAANRADPFAAQRADANARINYLQSNPGAVASLPGYEAGLDAVMRRNAASGYLGSGNLSADLLKYGSTAYGNEINRLTNLATLSPGNVGNVYLQGKQNALDLQGRSLNNIAYAIGGR